MLSPAAEPASPWRKDSVSLGATGAVLHHNRCRPGRYSDAPRQTIRLFLIPSRPCALRVSVAGGAAVPVPVGALQLVAPRHAMRWEQDDDLEELELELPQSCWPDAFGSAQAPDLSALSGPRFHDPLLRCLMERLAGESAGHDVVLHAASLRMAGALLLAQAVPRPRRNGSKGLSGEKLARAQAVLLHPDGSVPEAAAAAGVSAAHFMRAFHATTGETPGAFQRRHRVAAAMARLRDDATSIAEIASACGFADQAHMTRTFRTMVGLTPGQVRREARAG